MLYKEILGLITVILAMGSYVPYIKNALFGKTRPHAFSWLIWTILTGVGFFIQTANGAGPGAWFNGVMTVVCAILTVIGFVKGRKEIISYDWISFILAFVAIYLWLVEKDPTISIAFVIVADALGMVPTVRKSFVHPYSETMETYAINAFRVFLAIFALDKFTFVTASYHVYMICANMLLVAILVLRRKKIT